MSFGPRLRAARGPATKAEEKELGFLGALGFGPQMAFLQARNFPLAC